MSNSYPKMINHIGVRVNDIGAAIRFYTDTFGFKIIRGPETISAG
jgi:catechol 2,3-dioxygenase-like lactoylglutathione lyase family enzyme